MKLHYLGTAAAESLPATFCECDICKTARARGGREILSNYLAFEGMLRYGFVARGIC